MAKSRKSKSPKKKTLVSKTKAKAKLRKKPAIPVKPVKKPAKKTTRKPVKKAPKQVTLVELRKQARGLGIPGANKLSRASLTRRITKTRLANKLAREARIKARERAQRAAAKKLAKEKANLESERKRLVRNARAKARRATLKLVKLSQPEVPVAPPPPPSSEEPLTEEIPPSGEPPSEPILPALPDTAPISERETRTEIRAEQIAKAEEKLELEKERIEQQQRQIADWIEQNRPEFFISIIDGAVRKIPSRARTDVKAGDWYERLQKYPEGSRGWNAIIEEIMAEAAQAGNYYSEREIWTLGMSP